MTLQGHRSERIAEEIRNEVSLMLAGELKDPRLAIPLSVTEVRVTPEGSAVANYGFDVTPARLVTGLITERGVCEANDKSIRALFPERAP